MNQSMLVSISESFNALLEAIELRVELKKSLVEGSDGTSAASRFNSDDKVGFQRMRHLVPGKQNIRVTQKLAVRMKKK